MEDWNFINTQNVDNTYFTISRRQSSLDVVITRLRYQRKYVTSGYETIIQTLVAGDRVNLCEQENKDYFQ